MPRTVYLKYTHKHAQPNTQFEQFPHMTKHPSMSSRLETAQMNTFKWAKHSKNVFNVPKINQKYYKIVLKN